MSRRVLVSALWLLLVAGLIAGCSGHLNAEIDTTIGTFTVERISFEDTYGDSMTAQSGSKILVIAMLPKAAFDQTQFKNTFASEDGSRVANAIADGVGYSCVAVAVQGDPEEDDVEYCLVFNVPAAVEDAKALYLQVPDREQVLIKGKA